MGRLSLLSAVLFCAVVATYSSEHSLFYTYTALSKPLNLPGVYEFTALGMLDDRELDYYSSVNQVKVPKQTWMKEKMEEDYWNKGTESRKSKEQWFKVNVEILMERMRHNKSDLHVLQWRHGCVVKNGQTEKLTFLRGVDEYSYDGSEFLSFDEENSRWIAPVQAAEPTKRKWDDVAILNQYTKGYLEKECVGWLAKFMEYGKEELKNHSRPEGYIFVKKSVTDPSKFTLTCLATGFYPKDVQMQVRKSRTSLPEHLVSSSGIRPNGDGTYQLRKSVEIIVEDKELYDCYVTHSTLTEPLIVKPGDEGIKCMDCIVPQVQSGIIGGVIGVVLTLAVVGGIVCFLRMRRRNGNENPPAPRVEVPFLPGHVVPVNPGDNHESTPMITAIPDIQTNSDGGENDTDSGQGSDGSPQGSQGNVSDGTETTGEDAALV